MTTITHALLAALLPLGLGATAGPVAAAEPQPPGSIAIDPSTRVADEKTYYSVMLSRL